MQPTFSTMQFVYFLLLPKKRVLHTTRLQQLPKGDHCSVSSGKEHLFNASINPTFLVN